MGSKINLKLILILSHGSGRVEGGFSINESIILNGMKERSVIAQRTVHNWILHSGERLSRDLVDKRMMDAIKGCRQRYEKALKTDQKNHTQKEAVRAEKRKIMRDFSTLQQKRQTIDQQVKQDKEMLDLEADHKKQKMSNLCRQLIIFHGKGFFEFRGTSLCKSQGICLANVRENREMSGNFKLKIPWDPC